jgi:uncharacterized protein YjiS (DUF1127 family)
MATMTDRMAHGFPRNCRRFSPRPSLRVATSRAVDNLVTTLLDWQERARQRRQLLALDEAALKDFGRNFADAVREADKPCWRS